MGEHEEHGGMDEAHGERKVDFVRSKGLTSAEAEELLKLHGRNELEERRVPSWLVFLRMLYQPMPLMIWAAAIIEGAIENFIDMGILLGIQFINATLGWYETTKAGDAVAALKASLKPTATAKRDGKWQNLDASLLVPGDLVLLASGSAVPADCLINEGQIDVDQAALTGESLPVTMYPGDSAKMGSTVVRGEVEGTVEFTGKNTFFGKTAAMLQQGDNELGHLQKILLTIMIVLVVISFVLCGTAFGYLLGMDEDVKESLSFTVVLLVASIPIAIEIVCTTTLALGSRQLSAHGAIVTRLAAIEDMAGMNMLCSDKTGTLTLNKMVIQEDTPTYMPGLDQAQVLRYAALAAKWKEPARDALDTLVLGAVDLPSLDAYTQIDFMPFDPTVKRTEGTLRGPDGVTFKTTKGAPHIILKLVDDNPDVVRAVEAKVHDLGLRGIRALAVAKTNPDTGKWQMVGLLTFLDPPRPDTKETIHKAMAFGVDVKMITGDHLLIAKETARQLGMGVNIQNPAGLPTMGADGKPPKDLGKNFGQIILEADGFAQVYPEHKYLIVEALRQNGFAVGMTGDGVNDAPALKRADVGVAVQGSTDAARAAADIVLTKPGLSVIVEGIIIARCIFQRMKNFINYRIAATLQLLLFFFIAVLSLQPKEYEPVQHDLTTEEACKAAGFYWNHREHGKEEHYCSADKAVWPNFFKMPVLMLMLITLLNDGALISIGYDNVNPSNMPEKWNLPALFCVSIILGIVACGSSLLLLWAALDSWNPDGLFADWGIDPMTYGKIITMVYLKVSVSDFLTLFSARTHEEFFFQSRPALITLIAAGAALAISTILACVWPKGKTDGVAAEGLAWGDYTLMPLWIWIYCIVWWWIQDALKVVGYWVLHRYNIFNINNAQLVNNREANTAADASKPLARMSVGLVENKLLQAKVEDAIQKIERASKDPNLAPLARTSVTMVHNLEAVKRAGHLARTSMQAAQGVSRISGQAAGAHDAEAGTNVIGGMVKQLEAAAGEINRPEITVAVEDVRRAAERLNAATAAGAGEIAAIQRRSGTPGDHTKA